MKTFYAKDRKTWREWLAKNHDKESEVWLIYYKKSTEIPFVSYNDAVEEALCFGWIDSTQRPRDKESYMQRFTPRKNKKNWSELNKERARRLIASNQMAPSGIKMLEGIDLTYQPIILSEEIEAALKIDSDVWANWNKFNHVYQRLRIGYILEGKRQGKEEFDRRLNSLIKATKKNKKIGTII